MFSALQPRESAVDACARAIREAIIAGELAPGSRLPPERKLAETFGVNRVTVRGALSRLAHSRLLSVRQGSGYVVRDYRKVGGPDLLGGLAALATARGDLPGVAADLLLVRRHLARAVLERVCLRADDAPKAITRDLRAFEQAVDRFEATASAGADDAALAAADLEIVAALLDLTGSAALGVCMNPIQQALAELPALRAAMYAEPMGNVAGWRMLAAWLAAPERPLIDAIIAELERRDAATLSRLPTKRKTRS